MDGDGGDGGPVDRVAAPHIVGFCDLQYLSLMGVSLHKLLFPQSCTGVQSRLSMPTKL